MVPGTGDEGLGADVPMAGVHGDADGALERARAAMAELVEATSRVVGARRARDDAIVDALAAGLSLGEVARRLQVSKSLVRLVAVEAAKAAKAAASAQAAQAAASAQAAQSTQAAQAAAMAALPEPAPVPLDELAAAPVDVTGSDPADVSRADIQ